MASASAFKVTCGSCGEAIAIRDPKVIGKKIDCPACKYRFIVEDPDAKGQTNGAAKANGATKAKSGNRLKAAAAAKTDEPHETFGFVEEEPPELEDDLEQLLLANSGTQSEEADAAPKGKSKKKRKKKKKGKGFTLTAKQKQIAGYALAGAGVLLLIVAAVFLMGPSGKSGRSRLNNFFGGYEEEQAKKDDKKKKRKRFIPQPGGGPSFAGSADKAFTNLLPNTSEHVEHIHVEHIRKVAAGKILFHEEGGLGDPMMAARLGFSPKAVDQVLYAESYTNGWSYNAIHSTYSFNENALVKALGLVEAEGGAINGQRYYKITKHNPWLQEFSRLALASRRYFLPVGVKKTDPTLYVRLHDKQTLIIANRAPMLAFLEVGGKFQPLDDGELGTKPGKPVGPGTVPPNGEPGTSPNFQPGESDPPKEESNLSPDDDINESAQVGGGDPQGNPGESPTPGEVDPDFGGQPGISPMPPGDSDDHQRLNPDESLGPGTYRTIEKRLRDMMRKMEHVDKGSKTQVLFSSATDMVKARLTNPNPLLENVLTWRLRHMWDVTQVLSEETPRLRVLGISVRKRDKGKFQLQNLLVCDTPDSAQGLHYDLHHDGLPQVTGFFHSVFQHKVALVNDTPPVKKPMIPGGNGNLPPGSGGPAPPGAPGAGGGGGGDGPPGGGGSPNFGGGGPAPPGTGGGGGGMLPDGGNGYTTPSPNRKTETDANHSQVAVAWKGNQVQFTLDLVLENKTHEMQFRDHTTLAAAALLAQLRVALADDHRQRLGHAVEQLGLEQGRFPTGATVRTGGGPIAQDPLERISWMAQLLPFMEHHRLSSSIHEQLSWKHPHNWMAARTIVPEFIDPSYPINLRTVKYPGLPLDVGATHFVGVAGVGVNAAQYRLGDPNVRGKLGMFGYNRHTTVQMLQNNGRGESNTVVLIQVPPDSASGVTPWIAGGGSTVRGIPEHNSIAPFVGNHGKYGRGTFVLMADGSVRFVSENVTDEVFKSMCTIHGPLPKNVNLDQTGQWLHRGSVAKQKLAAEQKKKQTQPKTDKKPSPPVKGKVPPKTGQKTSWLQPIVDPLRREIGIRRRCLT